MTAPKEPSDTDTTKSGSMTGTAQPSVVTMPGPNNDLLKSLQASRDQDKPSPYLFCNEGETEGEVVHEFSTDAWRAGLAGQDDTEKSNLNTTS